MREPTRRGVLRGGGTVAIVAIAGCGGDGSDGSDGDADDAGDAGGDDGDDGGGAGPGGPVTVSLSVTSAHREDGVAAGLDDLRTARFDVGVFALERDDSDTVTVDVGETLDLASIEDLGYDDREFLVENASVPAATYGRVTLALSPADVTGPEGEDVTFENVDPFPVTTFDEAFGDGDSVEILLEFRPFRREGADRWEMSSSVGLYT